MIPRIQVAEFACELSTQAQLYKSIRTFYMKSRLCQQNVQIVMVKDLYCNFDLVNFNTWISKGRGAWGDNLSSLENVDLQFCQHLFSF